MAATTWPFRLAALTLDNEALFKDTSDALFSASACCLDKRFTGKLRSLVGSLEGLKAADAVLDAVRVWSWRKRFDNMSTERLLKRYRVASPSHPDVVRSCARAPAERRFGPEAHDVSSSLGPRCTDPLVAVEDCQAACETEA